MALLSKSCLYGLRTAIFVAQQNHNAFIPISDIAKELDIPADFLTKILQRLTKKNIMNSLRGVKGGVRLGKSPDKISMYDIVQAIDGETIFKKCFLNLEGCGEEAPCPFHESWKDFRTNLGNMLKDTSLTFLIENKKFTRLK
ncbi:MAG: Rrf2 family transcriptional regulator [Ignavibacteriae bacterium]|nr:Rrf2 family transcriptional regulator [Ignavibacteriota bacterium]